MLTLFLSMVVTAEPQPALVPHEVVTNPKTYLALELARARIRLSNFKAIATDIHPKLIRQRRHVEVLQKALDKKDGEIDNEIVAAVIDAQIATVESKLLFLKTQYSDDHPEVILHERWLKNLAILKKTSREKDK